MQEVSDGHDARLDGPLAEVTPRYAAAAGAGSTGAGLVTGVLLLGTVAAELAAPILMKRYGYRALLAAGAALLGVPTLALGTASALWNLAYDAGYGAGPAVFGLLAGHTGYPAAFALTGVLMVAALPAAWPEHSHAAAAGYRASTT